LCCDGQERRSGIDSAPDGTRLVSSADSVVKIDAATGARIGPFIAGGAGGIESQVFLAVIPKAVEANVPDAAQIGSQFWVVGDAAFHGRVPHMPQVLSAH